MNKKFSLLACLASLAVSLIGCSNEKVAGTVTDTGNTLAETQVSGVVLRVDGTPHRMPWSVWPAWLFTIVSCMFPNKSKS